MSRLGRGWKDFDLYILITTVVLMGFGAVTIYSADGGGPLTLSNLGVRQAVYGTLGLVMMFVVASIDYRILGSLGWAIYAIAMSALALVIVPGIGVEIGGARRWFDLGFTTVQPSEFAKVATVIALSAFVASRGQAMHEFGNVAISLLIVLVPMALVFRQPDLGSSLVFAVIWIAVMTVAHLQKRYWAALMIITPLTIVAGWEISACGLSEASLDGLPRPRSGPAR